MQPSDQQRLIQQRQLQAIQNQQQQRHDQGPVRQQTEQHRQHLLVAAAQQAAQLHGYTQLQTAPPRQEQQRLSPLGEAIARTSDHFFQPQATTSSSPRVSAIKANSTSSNNGTPRSTDIPDSVVCAKGKESDSRQANEPVASRRGQKEMLFTGSGETDKKPNASMPHSAEQSRIDSTILFRSTSQKSIITGKKSGKSENSGKSGKSGKSGGKSDKERKTRSRLACLACKATKQKCDGPVRIPCRRCELYGLECKFPSAAGVLLASTSNLPASKSADAYNNVSASVEEASAFSAPAAASASNPPPGLVTQKLFEIASRLQSIESALNLSHDGHRSHSLPSQASHPELKHPRSTGFSHISPLGASSQSVSASHVAQSHSSDDGIDMDLEGDVEERDGEQTDHSQSSGAVGLLSLSMAAQSNPIQEINLSIDKIVGKKEKDSQLSQMQGMEGGRKWVNGDAIVPLGGETDDDYGAPDVLRRGVLTGSECQELFDFFFASIHPWVMMLSLDSDRDAAAVLARSTLLFHTILLLSTSYSTPFPSRLHTTLITFTNSILAPQILNPQPHELTTDFLRAIDLLNLYKPTQLAARKAEGKDEAEAMRASKVNGLASWMLQGILGKTADRLDLASVLPKFSRAYSARKSGQAIPGDLLRDLRLYFWLLSNDVHGNVQSGRRCNMEGVSALATTRLFSSLQLQPYDTRLAASVEMFEVARPILRSFSYERTRRISRADLERYNVGMSAWEDFWLPILQRQLDVDPLAMSVLCPFAWFITLTYNATTYVSWKQSRSGSADSETGTGSTYSRLGKRMRTEVVRGLTDWEFMGLKTCVKAAEGLIFTLSEESRVRGGWRKVQWAEAERADGWRKLVLDESVVELSKWGMDAITCVAYIFPCVFLCKLVNEGILTSDLVLLRDPQPQQLWLPPQKLPRLLELCAAFLDAIALIPHHPAKAQAQVLRVLLETGVKGRAPSPQLPRHAATVMSPLMTGASSPSFPEEGGSSGNQSPWQTGSMGNRSGGAATQNMLFYQQQQLAQQQQHQQLLHGQSPTQSPFAHHQSEHQLDESPVGHSMPPSRPDTSLGMDTALNAVLDGLDPLFGETSMFWECGGISTGQEVDWAAVQANMR